MHHQAADSVTFDEAPNFARPHIPCRRRQNAIGGKGFYVNVHEEKRSMKLGDFKKIALEQSASAISSRRNGRETQGTYTPEVLLHCNSSISMHLHSKLPRRARACALRWLHAPMPAPRRCSRSWRSASGATSSSTRPCTAPTAPCPKVPSIIYIYIIYIYI